jgi:hypothetical protein
MAREKLKFIRPVHALRLNLLHSSHRNSEMAGKIEILIRPLHALRLDRLHSSHRNPEMTRKDQMFFIG